VANQTKGPAATLIQYRESVLRMTENGMSQRAIATALNISQSSVHRILMQTESDDRNAITRLAAKLREHDQKVGLA
jgi:DNA-binding NarL/FixJ family response regulator